MIWIYDIEIYNNYFGVIFKNPKSGELNEYVIYKDRNDLKDLMSFIDDNKKWLVGYNNLNFDNQLLNYMHLNQYELERLNSYHICQRVYMLAKSIINDEAFNLYKYNLPFQTLDLMKIAYLRKSLKLVGVVLKWHKLQDLPIDWEKEIEDSDLKLMHSYNLNDVLITEELYYKLLPQIKMRFDIAKKYNINVYSESESGIANRLLEKFYSESTGKHISEFKNLQTKRDRIPFNWVVFNNIKFKTLELNKLLSEIKNYIYYTKYPFLKKSIIFNKVKYQLGVGGLHSDDQPGVFTSTDNEEIIDCDIASFYPSIIVNHNIAPKHLGPLFIEQYRDILNTRLEAKKNKDNTVAGALKIVLNATYGKFKSKTHWLHDPLCALQVTINGQLYLLMLVEDLTLTGFDVISANTDGIVTKVPKSKYEKYLEVCRNWEDKTNFQLEYTKYKKYIRRDVNNYITIVNDTYTKEKGIFVVHDVNSDDPRHVLEALMKGVDKPIVSIALKEYFINNKDIKDTILNHDNIHDFSIAKKTDDKFWNEYHYIKDSSLVIDKLQKSVRFYISTKGGKLYKKDDSNRMIDYASRKTVQIINDYDKAKPISEYNIDYTYYIHETLKILQLIENPQLTLF